MRPAQMPLKRTVFIVTTSALAQLAAALPAVAQRDFSDVKIKRTHVAGAVHMLEGAGGNIGVSAGHDGILIVDDQFAPLADKIRDLLGGIRAGAPAFVLNTHWHGDHTGGNAEFAADATIIAHHNVRKRLSTPQTVRGRAVEPSPPEALPIITFDERLSIHFNGEEIRLIHLPHGHTDGDTAAIFTKSNVVHMGDQFFAGKFPFIDLDSGGDVVGYERNVATMLKAIPADARVIPGHGPLSTVEDLERFHEMLVKTTEIVRRHMAEGQSLEEIKKQGLPEEWAPWGTGFITTDAWIECLHKGLSRKREVKRK